MLAKVCSLKDKVTERLKVKHLDERPCPGHNICLHTRILKQFDTIVYFDELVCHAQDPGS